MIQFDSFMTNVFNNRIVLSAELIVMFDSSSQESYSPGTPFLWDAHLLSKIAIDEYDIINFFAYIIPRNRQSRITDYKKVWGLNRIANGSLDLSYNTESQTVYLGITQTHGEDGFKKSCSSLLFLLPKNMQYDSNMLLEMFAQRSCCFSAQEVSSVISDFCKKTPSAIVLWYSVKEIVTLTIFSNRIDSLFSNQDLSVFKEICTEVRSVYRRPFCNLYL